MNEQELPYEKRNTTAVLRGTNTCCGHYHRTVRAAEICGSNTFGEGNFGLVSQETHFRREMRNSPFAGMEPC